MEQSYFKDCDLCGETMEVKKDKRGKLFHQCSNCVTQTFVRGQEGMMRLMQQVTVVKKGVEHEETDTITSEEADTTTIGTGFGFL